jgi:hypothetical protein
MRKTRFSCSETTICNIAGIPFDTMTPEQRNQARILAMYFSTPETYHNNVLDEIRNFAQNINLLLVLLIQHRQQLLNHLSKK